MNAFGPWIDKKIEELTGVEDELITSYCISELEAADEKGPDPRKLHINLTGKSTGPWPRSELILKVFLTTRSTSS